MPTDAELLERYYRTNDAGAFNELARRYRNMVFASAQRVTSDRHDAEDVVQSCFYELARQPADVRTSVAAYLHRAATYRARNTIRERARRRKHEQQAATERSLQESSNTTAKDSGWESVAPQVDAAIEKLPEALRTPVILHYLRGLSEKEISYELGISKMTVQRRLRVGVRRLRATLSKSGIALSAGTLTICLKDGITQAAPASLKATLGRIALIGMDKPAGAPRCSSKRRLGQSVDWITPALRKWALCCIGFLAVLTTAWLCHSLWSPREHAYDRLEHIYQPYMASSYVWRASAMSRDTSAFWRGAQPFFFAWCKTHAGDWLADQDSYVACYASPYLQDALLLPRDIDVANSARFPFQLELLQAMVALRAENGFNADPRQPILDQQVFTAYRDALSHPEPASAVSGPVDSVDELSRFITDGGELRSVVYSNAKNIAEMVTPLTDKVSLAGALAQAMEHNPKFAALFPERTEQWISQHIAAAGARTHITSVASQGLLSILVVIRTESPANGGRMLIELHEITPAAAELGHAVTWDDRSSAERAAEDLAIFAPSGLPVSWCDYTTKPMLVRIHQASAERHNVSTLQAAGQWAVATASTHRNAANREYLLSQMTPELLARLTERADDCADTLNRDWQDFRADPRSQANFTTVENNIAVRLTEIYRQGRQQKENK